MSPREQEPAEWGEGWLLRVAIVIFVVATGLGLSEVVVRIFAPQPLVSPLTDSLGGLDLLRPGLHARARVPHEFDVRMTINGQRFRAPADYGLKPGPAIRIAVLGDSFTFGAGVNDGEPYPRVLEDILRASGLDAEVINAGVPALGTGEEALYYREWVRRFHPAIVVLTITSSDPDDDAERALFAIQADGSARPRPADQIAGASKRLQTIRRFTFSAPIRFLAEHSALYSLIRQTVSNRLRNSRREALTSARSTSTTSDELRMTRAEIQWLNQQVTSDGGRLIVAYFPPAETVQPERYPASGEERQSDSALATSVYASCTDLKIPFVDATATMQAEAQWSLYYQGVDEHPNALGYRVFARTVAQFLLKHHELTAAARGSAR